VFYHKNGLKYLHGEVLNVTNDNNLVWNISLLQVVDWTFC